MKTTKSLKNENGMPINIPRTVHGIKHDMDAEDEDADEENDEEEDNEGAHTTSSPPIDSCIASHEFEWLQPASSTPSVQIHPADKQSLMDTLEERLIQTSSVASIPPHPNHKSKKSSSSHQRRPKEHDYLSCRMSPTSCYDTHSCRHRMSPMRSSWCCPSPPPPPPHAPVCLNHSGLSLTGMEMIPVGQECCSEEYSYSLPCYCLPPLPGRQHVRHYNACNCTHVNSSYIGEPSPNSPQQAYRNSLQRSNQVVSRRREFSPSSSPLHRPYYSSDMSHLICPAKSSGNLWEEQWKPPVHSEDINGLHKIQQLESDKQNLLLQVSVLNEQVDAQKEKIKELEEMIGEKAHQVREIKQSLHEERMGKSAAENIRLELMTEISSLRQKLTIAERERRDSEEKCRRIEADMDLLSDRVGNTDGEHTSFRRLTGNNSTVISNEKGSDVEKLRRKLETVIASNEEKDNKIEGLRVALAKYKKLQEFVLLGQHRKGSDILKEIPSPDGECSRDLKSPPSPGIETLRQCHSLGKCTTKPLSSYRLPCQSSSSNECDAACPNGKEDSASVCSSINPDSSSHSVTINKSNSLENVHPSSPKVSLQKTAYGTIPRQNGPQALQHLQEQLQTFECTPTATNTDIVEGCQQLNRKSCEEPNRGSRNKSSGVSFGKGFFKLRSGKRSSSAPELAPSESVTIPVIEREYSSASPTPQPTMQPFIKPERSKGFRKFFTKWRQRSGSQNLEKIEGDFRRGGTRATAGPRLGWSRDISTDPNIPFPRWTTDFVIEWLHKIGLSMYISECKRWRCNGEQLINATPQEIEKQLNIKSPMHKKKLVLSLQAMKSDSLPASVNALDYFWVVRWLDDVGLPQYKDAFSDARIDGRVLHYLTIDDLLTLKVTNQLHHTSIKRGIQLLRERNFDPHCLVRRSMPDEDKAYTPEMVALWTNHRVMEWLRTVDLSEYAPNLRGSGVHGALIVYEPKFNTDLFATLLNIPPTKTLLRRHLATHFKTIVGAELAQMKRDLETDQLYTPLTPNIKIKGIRKPQFQLKKKKGKVDSEGEEFVCPMDIPVGAESQKPDGDKLVVRRNSDPVPQEKSLNIEDEKAVEEIGAVSKEIKSLTNLLQEEKLLKNAPTTIV